MRLSPQRRKICRRRNFKKCSETLRFVAFSLANALLPTAARNFSTLELQKVARHLHFFNTFTCKRTSPHSGAQFFDIGTSKSGPAPSFFQHVHLQTRFSPQRRAIFRHPNFKKCSDTVSFSILTWKCASRHSGVQFFDIGTAMFCTFSLENALLAKAPQNFLTSELQKVLQT